MADDGSMDDGSDSSGLGDLLDTVTDVANTAGVVANSYQVVKDGLTGLTQPIVAAPASVYQPYTSVYRPKSPNTLDTWSHWIKEHATLLLGVGTGLGLLLAVGSFFKKKKA